MEKYKKIFNLCGQAISQLDKAISNRDKSNSEEISLDVLLSIKKEIVKMQNVLDSSKYMPTYGRFLVDYPDESGLVDFLLRVSQEYKKRT